MARRTTFINDIVPGKIDWKIKVRVIRLWKVPHFTNPLVINSMEMLLLDEKFSKIHASIKRSLLPTFETVLQEGTSYLFQNLLVAQCDPKYKTTKHRFKLNFMGSTKCTPAEAPAIPPNYFDFIPFPEILSGLHDKCFIDVIGHIVEKRDFKETEKDGKKCKLIDIVLEDLEANRVECTLWEKFAEEMHAYLTNNATDNTVIVILQLCKIKTFNGQMGISNAYNGTKLMINPIMKEDCEYKEKLESSNNSLTQVVSYVSGQTNSLVDDLLQSERMTISEIVEAVEICCCVVLSKIIEIDTDMGWYYQSCPKCMRKVQQVGKQFKCDKCLRVVTPIPRYKLHVQVMDITGSTTFVLFDRNVSQYLGQSALNLLKSNDKANEGSECPAAFATFLNKDILFKVDITDSNIDHGWQSYTVRKMTDETALIEAFKKQHGIKEDEEADLKNLESAEVDDNMKVCAKDGDSMHKVHLTQQDDYPAEDLSQHTPSSKIVAKRVAEEVDLCSQHDECGTQTSTSKMPKFVEIKKEPAN